MNEQNNAKDRTSKQPLRWACMNAGCWKDGKRFEFMSDRPRCPKCTAEDYPFVMLISLSHLMTPNPQGPIQSQGRRWMIACDPKRTTLATATNQESMTGVPEIVNCPGCVAYIKKNRIKKPAAGKVILSGT